MRKLEFDGIIGAIDEKTNKLVLRVGSETYVKTDEGNFETKTDWINCYVALSEKGRYRVGDRYFFRGNMIVEPYVSKKEEGVAKAQIKVFVSEKPELLYRKKDTALYPLHRLNSAMMLKTCHFKCEPYEKNSSNMLMLGNK